MLLHSQQLSNGGYPAEVAEVDEEWGRTSVSFRPVLFRMLAWFSQPITVTLLSLRREDSARQTLHD